MRRALATTGWALGSLATLPALLAAQTPPTQGPQYVLDTIPVTVGTRADAAATRAVEVFTADEIRALPVRSVSDVLDWALSVDLQRRSQAQADVSLRGGTFEQVLVLVDGVRVSDPQTGHFDLDLTVPIDQVERIEVLRGGASAVYGADAFGGVINVVTKKGGPETSMDLRLQGGTFGEATGGLSATLPAGDWTVSAGASWDQSDGHRDGTDYDVGIVDLRASGPVAGGELTVAGGYAARDFGAADFYGPFPSYEETRARDLSARWVGPISETLDFTLVAATRRHDDDFVLRRGDPAFYQNIHRSDVTQLESTVGVDLGAGSRLVVGGDWAEETLESTNLGSREQTRTGAFAELATTRGRWSGQVGARIDDREDVQSTFFSPSAALAWTPSGRLRLRAGASRAFRAPTWTERFYEDPANVGNPNLAVERGWTMEFGADASLGTGAVVSGTAFRRTTEELIDYARPLSDPDARWEARNFESATFTGVEVQLRGLRFGAVELRGGATFLDLDTEESATFFSKSSLRPLTRNVMLAAATDLPMGATGQVMVQHRRRNSTEEGEFVDLRLTLPVARGEIWIDGENLLDDPMPDLTGFAVAGRTLRIGVRTRLGG